MTSPPTKRRLLGRGATGSVTLVDRSPDASWAVKHPRSDLAPSVLAICAELRGLAHPNLVRVLEIDRDEEGDFVALEHVDGMSLAELVRAAARVDEDVPPGVALRVMRDAASGLAALHAWGTPAGAGWAHRDLSPSNVLLGWDGGVRLADLDGAAPIAGASPPALPIRGKASYAAPELIERGEATAESDVFALGATIAEALVGTPIFASEERDEDALIELSDVLMERDDLPPALVELLFEMLALDPAHRPTASVVSARAEVLLESAAGPELASYLRSFAVEAPPSASPAIAAGPSAAAPWHVCGAAVTATIDYLIQHFGEPAYARTLDHVSPRTRDLLRESIDGAAWYDGSALVELTEAAQRLHGAGMRLAAAIGAWSAERALGPGGAYQIFRDKGLKKGVPAFIQALEDVYGLYYAQGEWIVEWVDEDRSLCRLAGVEYPPAMVERILGYLARGIELVGGVDVRVKSTATEGGLEIKATWQVAEPTA